MKKSLLTIALILVCIVSTMAQLQKLPSNSTPQLKKQTTVPQKTIGSTPSTTTTTQSQSTSSTVTSDTTQYFLTSVKARIFTGNDNKEAPSGVGMDLELVGGTVLYFFAYDKTNPFELKPNTNREISLNPVYTYNYYYSRLGLHLVQTHGLILKINYRANFFTDAWKIDKVVLILEFKDWKGNLHPTLGYKEVNFMNASKLLTDTDFSLFVETDGFLMPKN